MLRITSDLAHPLHDIAGTRRLEALAAASLPAHALMQRAGWAVARLALALTPHARTIWIACGPGNNGGDGLEAATHLHAWGKRVVVTWLGREDRMPQDAAASLLNARAAGVGFQPAPPTDLKPQDLCIDALLGIGSARAPDREMAAWIEAMNASEAMRLAVDVPSGLDADHGTASVDANTPRWSTVRANHTLSLLSLKPGLFTSLGRDAAGTVWLDDLGVANLPGIEPVARLSGRPAASRRPHASHKGSFGDVVVLGGEGLATQGHSMVGAAVLAGQAALYAGAGRVFLALLDPTPVAPTALQPELMLRAPEAMEVEAQTWVCGCGGGTAIRAHLSRVLSRAQRLVLDADALNAIAADTQLQTLLQRRSARGWSTVLTPHPLEASRLLGCSSQQVQFRRLDAATQLMQQFGCTVILKGSGSIIASPKQLPQINPTGNGRLAAAGTGDVLAGAVGSLLAQGLSAHEAACTAAWRHGHAADVWDRRLPLTASALAQRLTAQPD